jgi:hypothetical protein
MTSKTSVIKYDVAVTRGRKILATQTKTSWQLGDLALNVEVKYADNTVQQFADDIGIAYKTLLNYRTVAAAYVGDERSLNTFTVHEIFAPEDDRVDLVSSKLWTVAEARAEVKSRKDDGDVPEDGDGDGDGPADEPTLADELADAIANRDRLAGELQSAQAKVDKLTAQMNAEIKAAAKAAKPRGRRLAAAA